MSLPVWSNNETLHFIELYKNEPIIWNPQHKRFKDKTAVNDAWNRIAEVMEVSVPDLKRKKESLMSAFRANHKKVIASIKLGNEGDEIFKPSWLFYDAMVAFLGDVYDSKMYITDVEAVEADEDSSMKEEFLICDSENEDKDDQISARKQRSPTEIPTESQRTRTQENEENPTITLLNNVFGTINKALRNTEISSENEDECTLYSRLLAKRLRSYKEIERLEIMHEIDGLLLKKRKRLDMRLDPLEP